MLEELDLPLIISMSMSMFMLDGIMAIVEGCEIVAKVKKCIFANSLISTIMQDSGRRERSNGSKLCWKALIKLSLIIYHILYKD